MIRNGTALALALAICWSAAGQAARAEERRLSVTGAGSVTATPDMAQADFGVTAQRAAAADAFAAAAAAMTAVMAAIAAQGVAEADVSTTELSLSPVYAGGGDSPLRIDGYAARHRVAVTVRALTGLGPLLDAAARAGATDFGGVSFDAADRSVLVDAARRKAVADATRAASLLAEAAGVRLGLPVTILLEGAPQSGPVYRMAAMESAVPVAPGAISVSASVSMIFDIE